MGYITGSIKRIKRKISGHGIMNKAITAVFIVSSVITPLSPVFATTAYADEPETATVTLMDADNGSLSFEGTDDKAISVNVGSEVTVNVTPDDGYYADSLTIFNDDEEGAAVDVVDGSATFTVSGNTTVAAAFNENGSAGADALKPVEVSEQSNTASIEDYVLANADAQYVGGGDELSRKDVLTVTTTVVDGSKLTDATLDKLWEDTDGDGMADNYTAMLSQAVSHAVLFEVDPDADYYVGWVGADIQGAKLTDWAAAENNADAVMRDGFIMDEATGLVYVPKAYTKTNDEGQPMVASSRIQLVYTVQDASANATFDFSGSASDSSADGVDEGKVSVPVVSAYARVTLSSDGAPVDGNLIDSVTVNGIEYTSDMDMWSYDEETGTLEFFMAPAGIHCMSVNMSSNLLKSAASFFGISTYATSGVNNIGTWEFNSTPQAGFKFKVSASNTYGKNHSSGGILPAIENPSAGNYENKTIYQALGTQGVDLSKLKSGNYSIMRSTTIHPQTTSGVTIPGTAKLGLTCAHVGVNQNFQLDSGYNDPFGSWTDELGAQVNVVAVYGSTAIIGVVVPTSNTQAGGGFFEINWKLNNGYAKVKKVSANPSITDGNDCYSLKGAEFTVYNGGGSPVGTLTTDESGNTNTIELPTGTYTLKETKTPNGYLKAADQQFTVNGGQTTTITVADPPANDPAVMLVGKYDGEKTYTEIEGNMPQGSASLAGAEFTIEYYDTLDYDSYEAIKDANVEPTRSWVVRTDDDGYARLSEDYLVSGDSLYYATNGETTLPRGIMVIYESKAPEGYLLNNNDVSFQKIQENPTESVISYNTPEVPESIIRGGVAVQKLDSETGKTPQGNGSLKGITFSVTNDNENDVIVNGKSYAPGEVVTTITTDDNGYAATSDDALPYGSYIIRETGTNDSYLNTSDEIHATISEDGTVYDFTASDDVIRGGIEFDKRDAESGLDAPLGDAAPFDGTEFEITTLNDNPVIVDGVTYSKGDVVKTLVVKDGHASTSDDCLPYGKYSLREVKATEGYNLNDTVHEFSITEDGAIVNPFADTNGAAQNQVKRSDLEFSKKQDDTAERLAGVAFKVTSNTTGESHVVVTDENGYFSSASSWNAHTNNTNGNDWALSADGIIDSSKLDPTAGVWFGLVSDDGSITQPNDSLGAFPYDSYTIEELRCTANDGYQLINTSVIISRDSKTYDFGTLDDVKPTITTNASDALDGDSSVGVGEVKVFDKVSYADLIPGRTYKLAAELHDAKTGDAIKGSDGKAIKVEKTFTPEKSIGSENVEISLSTYDLAGKTITVYERLYDAGGSLLAEHTDKDDVSQQVTVVAPEIGTTATDSVDGDKNVSTDDAVTVTDSVAYKNLIPGKEYTLKGTLHVKKTDDEGKVTEEALVVDGKPVTAETTFTPEKADGKVNVTFTFNSLGLDDGTQVVAFETLEQQGHELAVHADIEDMPQTVIIRNPEISTMAFDTVDSDKNVVTDSESTIVDTVNYQNLVPGKEYTLKGTLHVKKTDDEGKVTEEALVVDGKPVTAETTFTPEKANGTANVTFTFDSRGLDKGTELVVFESLARGGNVIATHDDIEDVKQTVTIIVPSISTVATDGVDGDKEITVDDETTIVDTVSYQDLVPGKEYTLKGTIYNKATGEALEVDGKPVTAETTFTPEKADGKVDVTFTFDSRNIEDKTQLVVYESLVRSGKELASHSNLNDANQTTIAKHPVIGTTALDGIDNDRNVVTDDESTIIDTVSYDGLLPGKEYTLKGTLHVKKTDDEGKVTEEALVVDGKPVTAETTFTPETASGTVEVKFTFDSRNIADRTDIVAFESLEKNGVEIASHTDIEDVKQTVTVTHPVIGTTALDGHDGDKTVVTDGQTSIVDTVEYKNLIPGKEYTLKGTLYDKATGEALIPATEVGYERYNADTDTWQPFVTGRVENEDGSWTENDVHQNEDGSWTLTISGGSTDGDTGKSYLHTETVDKGEIRKVKQPAADAKPITAETTFTPEKADGKVDVTFTFDSTAIPDGTEVVAFESLEKNGVEIAVHSDIEDENQTVSMHKTGIGTTASDSLDGDKQVVADTETSITDEVAYKDILTGTDYTMAGILMDADTGLPILTGDGSDKFSEDDVKGFMAELSSLLGTGTEDEYEAIDLDALNKLLSDNADLVSHLVVQTKAFTPDKYDGTVSMDFGFNANDVIDRLSGETKDIVVYEVLFKGSLDADSEDAAPVAVATERDLDNEDQTVTLIPSVISTTATDKSDGDHTLLPGKDDVITDTVSYDGLIPGKEYTLKATLYDKSTGKPLSINDKHVTAELKFTPNNGSGTIDIDLGPFDATSLDGHDLVVFEELYKQSDIEGESTDVLVAEHKDINDEGQTVSVTSTPKGGFFGKTGGSDLGIIATIIVLVVAAGGLGCYAYKNRRVAKQNGDTEGAASESEAKATESDDDSNA